MQSRVSLYEGSRRYYHKQKRRQYMTMEKEIGVMWPPEIGRGKERIIS